MLRGGMATRHLWILGRLQINKLNFLNLQAEPSSNDEGIDLKLPLVLDASLSL